MYRSGRCGLSLSVPSSARCTRRNLSNCLERNGEEMLSRLSDRVRFELNQAYRNT